MHLSLPPPDPRRHRARPRDPRGPRRDHAQGAAEGRRATASRTPRSSRTRSAARSRRSRAPGRASRAPAAACRCLACGAIVPRGAEVLRRLRRADDRLATCRRSAGAPARRTRRRRSSGRRRADSTASTPARPSRPRPWPLGALHRARRGPRLARAAPRGERVAHGRRASSASTAWARRGSSASSSARPTPAGDRGRQTGPDPRWAEVGNFALRRAIVELAGLPRNGGGARDWAAATPRGAARPRRRLRPRAPSAASAIALSPEERRFVAAEALRWAIMRAQRGEWKARGPGHRRPSRGRRREPERLRRRAQRAAARGHAPRGHARPGLRPGLARPAPRRASLSGSQTSEVAQLFAASAGVSKPHRRPRRSSAGRAPLPPLYIDQLIRFTREQGGGAPARLADLIALRIERCPPTPARCSRRSPCGRRRQRRVPRSRSCPTTPTSSTSSSYLRTARDDPGQRGRPIKHDPPAHARGDPRRPSRPRCGASSHAAAADALGEPRGSPLEVQALHELPRRRTRSRR